jgi:enoyl-CoA hydratase
MSSVLAERRDGVLLLTLNRPERLNALDRATLGELDRWCGDLASDPDIRVVVVTGAGDRAFSAGADINELQVLEFDAAYEQMRLGQRVFDRIESLPQPVIAAVNGVALGGGCELALACDMRLAGPAARFGLPEITLANVPGWGGTQRLPRAVGASRARQMIYSGEPIAAETAEAWGLVNELVEDPAGAATALAERLAERAPLALRLAKETIAFGLDHGISAGLEQEALAVARCCQTDEQHAAVAAFLARAAAKRKAKQ